MEHGRIHGVEVGEGTGAVAQELPRFFFTHAADHLSDVSPFAEGEDEVGTVAADSEEQGTEQILVIRVHHQGELMCQHVLAVLVDACRGVVDFQGKGHSCLDVLNFPDLREGTPPEE